MQTWAEASNTCARFYDNYVSEWHPSKDMDGDALYDFYEDTLRNPNKPQCVDLLELLENVFAEIAPCAT